MTKGKTVNKNPDPLPNLIEVTSVFGAPAYVPGIKRYGDLIVKLDFNENISLVDQLRAYRNALAAGRKIYEHDGRDWYVASITLNHYNGANEVIVVIRVTEPWRPGIAKLRRPIDTGAFRHSVRSSGTSLDLHPNCRCTSAPVKEKLVKVNNKFYCASPNVTREKEQKQKNDGKNGTLAIRATDGGRWTRPTLEAAVEHAREQLRQNPELDHVAVVQIVRVVRRAELPLIVETVK